MQCLDISHASKSEEVDPSRLAKDDLSTSLLPDDINNICSKTAAGNAIVFSLQTKTSLFKFNESSLSTKILRCKLHNNFYRWWFDSFAIVHK